MNATETRFLTLGVLAAAYRGKDIAARTLLTHVVAEGAEKSLCGKLSVDRLCDEYAHTAAELAGPSSCPGCAARDPRHGGKLPRGWKAPS